jgi:hypothetical protein
VHAQGIVPGLFDVYTSLNYHLGLTLQFPNYLTGRRYVFAESAVVVKAASRIYGGFENQVTTPGKIRKAIVRVYEGRRPRLTATNPKINNNIS